jgi:uncharacterized membrane protein YcaP (DUF421 family)
MKELFFDNWDNLWHIALCAAISYLTLFIFVRISGKRTLSKMNAFDFVVTVTLGSTLSSMILAKVPILDGAVALAIIIALQYFLAYGAKKSKVLEDIINDKPTLLFYNGKFLEKAMTREVITEEEIIAEIRKYRLERIDDVRAVVMELNGEITVVKKADVLPGMNTSLDEFDVSTS